MKNSAIFAVLAVIRANIFLKYAACRSITITANVVQSFGTITECLRHIRLEVLRAAKF